MCASASKVFSPPSKRQRLKALGDTYQLDDDIRRAVTVNIDDCFLPFPIPNDDDWVSNHEETGQTVIEFEQTKTTIPIGQKHVIYVQPIDFFNHPRAPSLETICEFSRPFFPDCQFEILPAMDFSHLPRKEKIAQRINRHTRQLQYSAEDIIEHLKRIRRRERKNDQRELFCIAVTMIDIYPGPGWNFVFGLAAEDDGIGVYSFARLDPLFPIETTPPACTAEERLLILTRGIGVFIHEIIHLFGLEHCIYYLCMMNGGETLEETDGQPLRLCPICLRKMHSAFDKAKKPFNVIQMYTEIVDLCRRFGFKDEMVWYENRLRILTTTV